MATNMHRIYSFIGILLILVTKVSTAGFDFTCHSNQPLLLPNDGNNLVTTFPVGIDVGSSADFSRAIDTRNGNGPTLPTDSSTRNHPSPDLKDVKQLIMESTGRKERIGFFYCEATKGGTTYKIPTIILHETGDPKPVYKTITANSGDEVTLEVITDTKNNFYWYKDGGDTQLWQNQKQRTFKAVDISNAGFYECAIDGERATGTQAMMRLIVRGCAANLWGPLCDQQCPICYNGGVCDDATGVCICAAGFGGVQCVNMYGKNSFGQDGSFVCSSSNDDACRGKLFCQMDPYGCSCSAGYRGNDCDEDCNAGTYGADCKQTCHCQPGDICNEATGVCDSGICADGWKGPNCQVCVAKVTDIVIIDQMSTSIEISWTSLNNPDSYEVDYQLINEDNCKNNQGQRLVEYRGSGTSTTISNLIPYSIYMVYVKAMDALCDEDEMSISVTTSSVLPSAAPASVTSTSTATSIDFSWSQVPCGSRGGLITSYGYVFDSKLGSTNSQSTKLDQLMSCTSYTFSVRAVNDAGDGPYSSEVSARTNDAVPGAVTSLVVSTMQNGLQITWESANLPCADKFRVSTELTSQDQCDNTGGPKTAYRETTDNVFTVTGLSHYSTYNVYVQTINDVIGDGAETFSNGTTASAAPSAAPVGVTATSTTTSIDFSWSQVPCGSRGGLITSYNYVFDSTTGTSNSQFKTIDQLIPCTSHTFRVSAVNDVGSGPFSTDVTERTKDTAPGAVSSLSVSTRQNGLHITWDSTNLPCADKFRVSTELTSQDQCDNTGGPKNTFKESTDNFVTVTGLIPYSTYNVYVQTVNDKVGDGAETNSNGITETTAPTAAPVGVVSTATTTSIEFTWSHVPCGSRGGLITSYDYVFDGISGSSNSTSARFENLVPCTSHTFELRAVNEKGSGPYSSEVIARTQNEAPGAVNFLNIGPLQNGLQVSWSPPHPPCADKFKVSTKLTNQDQCNDSGGPKKFITETTESSIAITGLTPYSTYNVYILAVNNEAGDGAEVFISGNTSNTAPSAPPANVNTSALTNTSITFEWDRVPCGNRGGPNEFTYQMTDSKGSMITEDTPNLTVDIEELIPCTMYVFKVKAFNDDLSGEFSVPLEVETDIGVLGPVQSLTPIGTTFSSVTLAWDVQVESLCSTDRYYIEYSLINRDQCQKIVNTTWEGYDNVTSTDVTITGLEPHSTYQVRVYPVNGVGFGKVSDFVTIRTNESAPSGPPTEIDSTSERNSITFSWKEPTCGEQDGVISNYMYTLTPGDNKGDVENKTVTIEGLNPCTEYELQVRAVNSAGEGKDGIDTETTQNDVPFAPRDLSMSDEQKTLIAIKWEEPNPAHCPITNYTVSIRAVHKPYDEDFTPPEDPLEDVTVEKHFTFRNLEPCTEHEIKVYAHTESGIGPFIVRNFSTLPANEEELGEPVDKPKKRGSNATTITIQIPQLGEAPSPFITEFKVLVQSSTQFFGYQIWNTGEYEAGSVPKSQVKHDPYDFIVGSGNPAENIPLDKTVDNFISIGSCSVIGEEEGCVWSDTIRFGPAEPLNPASYIVPIIAVVLVAVLLGFVFIRQQRRAKDDPFEAVNMSEKAMKPSTSTAYNNEAYDKGLPRKLQQKPPQRKPPGPVKITDLAVYMRKKRVGDDYSFRDDFTLLPQELLHSYDAAKCEENRVKNRYANIATYDHSRVLLSIQGNDPHSDYINASHIDGYKHENQFIATQGPNEASIPHFWRMIWEQKITKIVMLTNLIEKNKIKCQQYWPKKVEQHETISVTLSQEEVFPNYTIRTFSLLNELFEGEALTVYQFHYTTWPDMDVPNDVAVVLKFMDLVDSYNPEHTQPVVVHCSAGVGRTGAFIAIQSLKKQAEAEGQIDVFKFITDMRHKRMKMIQTAKQYKFIYDALIKHCVFGDTSIPVSAFHEVYMNMKTSGAKKGKSALDTQYQILQDLTALPKPTECSGGTNEENINKNRFHDIIPADNCRPYLMAGGEGMSNYINASFIDNGIKTKDAYVTTQMPMPNTIGDIWRAVVDYKCSTFVMLNQLDPNDQTMAKYWPDKGQSATHGPITVECKSERETDKDVTTRIFQLRHKQTETTVVQFCLNNWQHDSKVLPDPEAVMNLALKVVDRMSRMTGDRVLVHCIDGMGVSGTFCAIVSALERIVEEQVVDIFQTAKTVRLCNPRAIQTKDQYRFVYEVIQANLNSSQVYENYVPN